MEEITVTTRQTYVGSDGTDYGITDSYTSDFDSTASLARRMRFAATVDGNVVLSFGTTPAYNTQLRGPGLLFLVNRSERADMYITIDGTLGATHGRKIPAGGWLLLDVTDIDQQSYASPLNYSPQPINSVTARSQHATGKGEYLSIYKSNT